MEKLTLSISEYEKETVKYEDNSLERFIKRSKELITQHLDYYSKQDREQVKNINIHLNTN